VALVFTIGVNQWMRDWQVRGSYHSKLRKGGACQAHTARQNAIVQDKNLWTCDWIGGWAGGYGSTYLIQEAHGGCSKPPLLYMTQHEDGLIRFAVRILLTRRHY
jgi:hypothetical protein